MPSVSYSPAAERDVQCAIDWLIRVGGAGLAERFVQALSRSARRCAEFPASGSTAWASLSNNLAGIRRQSVRAPFQKWLIFYRSSPDSIVVVRLLHTARDLGSVFPDDGYRPPTSGASLLRERASTAA